MKTSYKKAGKIVDGLSEKETRITENIRAWVDPSGYVQFYNDETENRVIIENLPVAVAVVHTILLTGKWDAYGTGFTFYTGQIHNIIN